MPERLEEGADPVCGQYGAPQAAACAWACPCLTIVPWCRRRKGAQQRVRVRAALWWCERKSLQRAAGGQKVQRMRVRWSAEESLGGCQGRIAGEGVNPGLGVRGMPRRWARSICLTASAPVLLGGPFNDCGAVVPWCNAGGPVASARWQRRRGVACLLLFSRACVRRSSRGVAINTRWLGVRTCKCLLSFPATPPVINRQNGHCNPVCCNS